MLWVVQILLALLFLFAGGSKLIMSAAQLTGGTSIPAWFLRFIGVMEILGGLRSDTCPACCAFTSRSLRWQPSDFQSS